MREREREREISKRKNKSKYDRKCVGGMKMYRNYLQDGDATDEASLGNSQLVFKSFQGYLGVRVKGQGEVFTLRFSPLKGRTGVCVCVFWCV